jgi:glycosyltransferase involved in cell wall biosynthesis
LIVLSASPKKVRDFGAIFILADIWQAAMPRELTLVIHALNTGGAEKVMAAMANHWAEQGARVTLITLDATETDRFYLHPEVRRVGLGLMRDSKYPWQAVWNSVERILRLRRAIRDARGQHVVSFTDKMNVLTLLASVGRPWDVVIAERNDPRWQKMGFGWELLRRWTYPRCSAFVVQTEAVARCARRLIGKRPVHVIPNAVEPVERPTQDSRAGTRSHRRIVAMGRLAAQKGFDLLIRAFALVAEKHPDWSLQILGNGDQHESLASLAVTLELADRVELCGWVDRPNIYLHQGDLFVLSSRYEGFPNALLEAMACGLPVISFDCDSGPKEIVRHEVDGLLVPAEDVDALAGAMDRLMADGAERARLAEKAPDVLQRFSRDAFFGRWEDVLSGLQD